jgi:hypothetical protein
VTDQELLLRAYLRRQEALAQLQARVLLAALAQALQGADGRIHMSADLLLGLT